MPMKSRKRMTASPESRNSTGRKSEFWYQLRSWFDALPEAYLRRVPTCESGQGPLKAASRHMHCSSYSAMILFWVLIKWRNGVGEKKSTSLVVLRTEGKKLKVCTLKQIYLNQYLLLELQWAMWKGEVLRIIECFWWRDVVCILTEKERAPKLASNKSPRFQYE